MRFLFVAKQKKVVEAFVGTLRALIDRGHSVTLALQEHDEKRSERFETAISDPRFSVVPCPEVRSDTWADVASLLRRLRDCIHYLRPPLRGATKLRARVLNRLRQDLQFEGDLDVVADGLLTIPSDHASRIDRILNLAEQRLPPDPRFDAFLEEHAPDVLLLSPVVHFGPAQADLIASARHRGIPAWMLLYSWDNLSTKGALHRWPDRMLVWNEHQRREAELLHGFPPERVVVVGAPRFDEFFEQRPAMRRDEFLTPLDLGPSDPTLLYVCSSRFVSESELPFVRRWIAALRASASKRLQTCNIIVRPHPDIALLSTGTRIARHQWPTARDLVARVARPFDDPRAIVLVTPNDTPRGLFESIIHSDAVIGLNTTAEIEAGIAGRPVFTILADEREADGQRTTMHFHYLLRENGGFVSTAATFDEHVAQLDAALDKPEEAASIHRFIESFVRPHGFDKRVSPLLADVLQTTATRGFGAVVDAHAPSATDDVELQDTAGRKGERAVLPLGESRLGLFVYSASIANRRSCSGAVPLEQTVMDWIERDIAIGDVVYEVGSGIGEYALVIARQKGATVIAFEPGYAAHAEFCDNILLNHCEALIVPVPLALAGRDGLAEIKYLQDRPGEPGYLVRSDIEWRVKHRGPTKPYLQPACLVSLDSFVECQRPPSPHHIRLAPGVDVAAVLSGAIETLRLRSLKTLSIELPEPDAATLRHEFAQRDWMAEARVSGADVQLVFRRHAS